MGLGLILIMVQCFYIYCDTLCYFLYLDICLFVCLLAFIVVMFFNFGNFKSYYLFMFVCLLALTYDTFMSHWFVVYHVN